MAAGIVLLAGSGSMMLDRPTTVERAIVSGASGGLIALQYDAHVTPAANSPYLFKMPAGGSTAQTFEMGLKFAAGTTFLVTGAANDFVHLVLS